MDSKKVVQATATPPAPLQLRNKTRPDVAPSISGVRRRSGPNQGLRSPAAKRPVSAPVALQGWLHKQGSEGLMLWKKRWFVLSDYCLFYYKGPEEEKLLGSILLPSYRVTVCKPEDKINKKFAFKAEHANMRTYHFAADTRESMNQWVTALTLASLLQDPNPGGGDAAAAADAAGPADGDRSARPSVSSISSILNQSADDSDSGFHGFQSRDDPSHASNNNSSPNSVNTGSFPNMSASNSMNNGNNNNSNAVMHDSPQPQPLVNGWMQHSPQYGQAGPSQHHTQYNKMMVDVTQQQAGHPHSAMVLQQHPHQQQHPHMMQQHVSPQTHPHKLPMSPPQMQMQQPGPSNVHTVQPMPRNFGQPVYANAPPKPRRLNDNDYSTPSPDPEYRKSPVSPEVRVPSKSPMANVEYDRNPVIYGQRMSVQQQMHQMRTDKSGLNYGYNQMQPTERRTPDTYGRSAKPCRPVRTNGDYEDVYGGPQLYQRPAGPVGYNKSPAPAPMPVYNPQQQQQPQIPQQPVHPQYYVTTGPAVVPRQQRVQPPPRPHSADFLDYEATHKPNPQTPPHTVNVDSQPRCPQRPKSSLDIANPSDVAANDGYFYSEERTDRRDESVLCNRYAAQMRQSAVYLHQTPQHHQQQRNQSLSRTTTPSKSTASRDTESGIGTLSEVSCASIRRSHREHSHQQHSLPRLADNDAHLRRSLRERSYQSSAATREVLIQNECGTLPSRVPRDYESIIGGVRPTGHAGGHVNHNAHVGQTYQVGSSNAGARRWNEQQFARSASARLPRTRHPAIIDHDDDDDDYTERSSGQDSRDGDRKMQQREESMKRLLEWKQRMLQSPLTRKPSGSTNRGTGQNDLSTCYKQQALQDLAAHEASVAEARHSRRRDDGHRPHVRSKSSDGRRSVTSVPRYNSYSSDDEASGSGSVIGRDPLPPRAVSTSQLPQRSHTQYASAQVSTLPLPRSSGVGGHHRQQPLPVHQSPPQSVKQPAHDSSISSQILRAASSGDVRLTNSSMLGNDSRDSRMASPGSGQRLVSPAGHLRVISPIDHRVSSPSDSERHIHSPNDRSLGSPVGRDSERGSNSTLRQIQRGATRESTDLLHKRARLAELDTPRRLENLQKLEELKKHLMDLEKQYEKGKPLVNLVDNMVKLGSLYNRNTPNGMTSISGSRHDLLQETAREHRDRLEFNQRVQEQRLLAEERRDWDRLSPDHGQLQAKVQQLYKLDRLLQEESGTLHSLQQDKEILEKALGGLRHKMQGSRSNPAEVERYRKQQLLLERELSRVRLLLAHNSKKLEETVAENARLEQDLVVLRQKLQASRRYAGNMTRDSSGTTAALETELRRVQQLVGDLQRQRQELSIQVRQLTEKSHSLVQQIRPHDGSTAQVHHHSKKRMPSSWVETDLDSGMTMDLGLDSSVNSTPATSPHGKLNGSAHQHHLSSPQYKDPPPPSKDNSILHRCLPTQTWQTSNQTTSPQNHISGLTPQLREQIQQHQLKQQMLKDQMQGKGSPVQANAVPIYINADSRRHENSKHLDHIPNGGPMLPPEYIPPPPPPPLDETILMNGFGHDDGKFAGLMHSREKQEIKTVRIVKRESERRQRDRGDRSGNHALPLTNGLNGLQAPGGAKRICEDELGSPQYEAQLDRVIEEIPAVQNNAQSPDHDDLQFQRSMSLPRGFGGQRPQPAASHVPAPAPPRSDSMNTLRNMMARRHRVKGMGRARDDLDMERALRPRINAPDVVRSTLSHKELKYNESTIDALLGAPNKIIIPERYIPEQAPELTAEEKEHRSKKAESIRKMLSETTVTAPDGTEDETNIEKSSTLKKKVAEEKRQREHILHLNQILAKQVMEKSKMVAVKALATLPLNLEPSFDEDDISPRTPLPVCQQRENFYT